MLSIKDIDTFLNTFPIQKDEIVPFAAKIGGGLLDPDTAVEFCKGCGMSITQFTHPFLSLYLNVARVCFGVFVFIIYSGNQNSLNISLGKKYLLSNSNAFILNSSVKVIYFSVTVFTYLFALNSSI